MTARTLVLLLLLGAPASAFAAAPPADKAGCTDHKLFPTRMPGYRLADCNVKEYDAFVFQTGKRELRPVEGKVTQLTYVADDKKDDQSGLAVVRNYENALKKIGGKIAATTPGSNPYWVNGSVIVDGKEVWAEAMRGNGKIWLRIVETKEMAQYITADAASFGNDLKSTGHTAVYGIYFDTNKSVVKPESAAALEEIAKLLKADPSLKLFVVGHTDSTGLVDGNMKLAEARAQAVIAALTTTHGIAAARLKGYGVGPLAPVASNESEDGRAKNRRVELVKQ